MHLARSVMIVAGGTGGHVYPGLAVASALRARGIDLYWMGTRGGLESRLAARHKFRFYPIFISGLRRAGFLRWLAAPITLSIALAQAVGAIVRAKPGLVLGMGGFVAGPGGLAAWLCGCPLIIHEQNAIPGLTNRILSHIAKSVLEAVPGSFPKNANALTTGNPVRDGIVDIEEPVFRLSNREGVNILIFGGSRGARTLNEHVPAALCVSTVQGLRVRHQSGADDVQETSERYVDCTNIEDIQVEAYIEDMAEAYRWADIVIARAGAITIAEIAACGAAAILVPYPYAVDDHQTVNARYLSDRQAAVLLPEQDVTTESLTGHITRLTNDREVLIKMAQNARKLGRSSATTDVVRCCLEVLDA